MPKLGVLWEGCLIGLALFILCKLVDDAEKEPWGWEEGGCFGAALGLIGLGFFVLGGS